MKMNEDSNVMGGNKYSRFSAANKDKDGKDFTDSLLE